MTLHVIIGTMLIKDSEYHELKVFCNGGPNAAPIETTRFDI